MKRKFLGLLLVSGAAPFTFCLASPDFTYHPPVPEHSQPSPEYLEKRKQLDDLEELQKKAAAEEDAKKEAARIMEEKIQEERLERQEAQRGKKERDYYSCKEKDVCGYYY
ncbi:hypothetical protein SK355_02750 [Candidatus Fukatsuia symbiotica]|uniref:hypothetical protein n=1 Tax=Candidatus Fukatsuia TaxID=1927833 RepID=UPI000934B1E9|nr:hypothetical protein [Candidatus Fukatsuia symbiotica]MEA9444251.1 hypothetical protein [Candidatus Fukatsuia symbiotica]